ncbi:NifU family protein [Variovorax sp. Sphag1AA]|uniref:NifU family protein n=1 Tax=Variovorax sp. Sphag1AA TaxID=2587027 RepID=UPI00161C65A4|nr:NifU family protein [Variovorax sp. Sphag1AA]MBB3178197.1 Fe-S cluster biogenesis protein NfuA [Variovorax sp. Sphag1AA]
METVQVRVQALDSLLRSHAGGLELQSFDERGVVRVRFTGMCVGCELRAVTASRVIEPVLRALNGVTAVEIAGGRVSEHALAALEASAGCDDLQAILRAVRRHEGDL